MEAEEFSHFFEVKVDLFDGPIDLLLHLVKKNELPIEKLSLAEVSSQYLECLERLKYFDLEIAGEYLVIASTLVSIKSSILLNEPVEMVIDDEGNLVNPHDILLARLREAAVYKDGASQLGLRPFLDIDVFESPSSLEKVSGIPVKYKNHDAILLGQAFHKLLKQASQKEGFSIVLESVSVVERMMSILNILKESSEGVEFSKLVPDVTSRMSIIGSFVALLELCKRHVINIKQDQLFSEITISLSSKDLNVQELSSNGQLSSEFDEPLSENEAEEVKLDHTANG